MLFSKNYFSIQDNLIMDRNKYTFFGKFCCTIIAWFSPYFYKELFLEILISKRRFEKNIRQTKTLWQKKLKLL
jgi:hypothetical protein